MTAVAYNTRTKTFGEYVEKLVKFEKHVIKLRNHLMYMLDHIRKCGPNAIVFQHAVVPTLYLTFADGVDDTNYVPLRFH